MTLPQRIADILNSTEFGGECTILGRIKSVRDHGKVGFIDIVDDSLEIQTVLEKPKLDAYTELMRLKEGSFVSVTGKLAKCGGQDEIHVSDMDVISKAIVDMTPTPWAMNGLNECHRDQVLGDAVHLYHPNPERMAAFKFYTTLRTEFMRYFEDSEFTYVVPPAMTDMILYRDELGVPIEINGEKAWLTQCSTFTLEAMALAYTKVYTISPAFRNESGGSRRHLNEYYHMKAEALYVDMEDLIDLASDSIFRAVKSTVLRTEREVELLGATIDLDKLNPSNHERITYREALRLVQEKGSSTPFGHDLSTSDEDILTSHMGDKYVWITKKPRESEGFPYCIDPDDSRLTLTGDLIAPHRSGELVGIAEKISDPEELLVRMEEKGKDPRKYRQYLQLRFVGMPPHGGLGAAPERIAYGLLDLPHIAYLMPVPHYPGRKIHSCGRINPWGDSDIEALLKAHGVNK